MNLVFVKIKYTALALIAGLLLLTACGEDSILNKTRQVSGTVVDQTTGQPLENVSVQLIADDDNPLVHAQVVQEMQTDASGKFKFTYERVKDIYRLELDKPSYAFKQFSKGKNGFPDSYASFQLLEYFKKEESFTFQMYPLGTLTVNLINTWPAASSDVINITCPGCESEKTGIVKAPRTYTFGGTSNQTLHVGPVAGHTYIRLHYQVTHNGQVQKQTDSIYAQPFVQNTLDLHY